jgi:hypothetical protein
MTQHKQMRRSNRSTPRGIAALVAVAFLASSALAYAPPGVPAGAGGYRGGSNNKNHKNNNENKKPSNPASTAQQPAEPAKLDTTALDQAKKDAAAAKTEQQKAQAAVAQARGKLMKGFDTKPEVIEAKTKLGTARAAYDAAASPVLKSLSTRSDYKASQAAMVKADEKVSTLRADTTATPEQRATAAKEALDARNAATKARNDALAGDPKIAQAKTNLDAATADLSKIRSAFEQSISTDPDLAAAQQALDDAKAKTKQADEAVIAARKDIDQQRTARTREMAEQRKVAEQARHQQQQQQSHAQLK